MVIESDDMHRCTEITKEGREIDIIRIGDVLLARDSLGSKFYRVVEEKTLMKIYLIYWKGNNL